MDIRLLLLDVDGVMTDGSILMDEGGREMKRFYVRDGSAIVMWKRLGLQIGILTGRPSEVTARRAGELGIELVSQGKAMEKLSAYEALRDRAGVADEHVAYLGDDLADLPVLRRVAYPMAPADGADDVRAVAKYTTDKPGGRGAVRDAVEHLLKGMNRWNEVLERYGA